MARIHWTPASQFARDFVNIQQSIVEEGVENVGKRTPSELQEKKKPIGEVNGLTAIPCHLEALP